MDAHPRSSAALWLGAVLLLALAALTGLRHDLYGDERWGWLAAVHMGVAPGLVESLRYECTAGPLLVASWCAIGSATHYSLPAMRFLQLLLALGAFVLVGVVARQIDRRREAGEPVPPGARSAAGLAPLAVLACPYFLPTSLFLVSDVAGLVPLLGLVCLLALGRPRSTRENLVLVGLGGVLLHVRVAFAGAVLGWFLAELVERREGWRGRAAACMLAAGSCVPFAAIIRDVARSIPYTAHPGIWPAVWSLGLLGLVYWPLVRRIHLGPRILLWLVPLALLGLMTGSLAPAGPLGLFVWKVSGVAGTGPGRVLAACLVVAGALVLLESSRDQAAVLGTRTVAFMTFALIFSPLLASVFWFERYALPVLVLQAVWIPPLGPRRRTVLALWLAVLTCVSLAQSFRWLGRLPGLTRWSPSLEHTMRIPWHGLEDGLAELDASDRRDPEDSGRRSLRRAVETVRGYTGPAHP